MQKGLGKTDLVRENGMSCKEHVEDTVRKELTEEGPRGGRKK